MSCEKQKTQVIEDFNINYSADGIIDSRSTTKSTYDKQGNLTRSLIKSDDNADGDVDYRATLSVIYYNYKHSGKTSGYILSTDQNADGHIDSTKYYSNFAEIQSGIPQRVRQDDVDKFLKIVVGGDFQLL